MQISQLEYLLAVDEAGSINQASINLLVSQSSLSTSLKNLEKELGKTLLVRGNQGVQLTPFGREFLPYARSVMTQIDQMKLLGVTGKAPTNKFIICNNNYRFTIEIIAKLYNRHRDENIEYTIKDCSRQEAMEMLSDFMAEIGILRIWSFQSTTMMKQIKSKNLLWVPLRIAPVSVVIGNKHPLYNYPDTRISSKKLLNFPVVMYEYAKFNPNINVKDMIPAIKNNKILSVTSRNAVTELLHNTEAIFLTASHNDKNPNALKDFDQCRIIELEDCSFNAQIGYMKHKSLLLSPIAQEFVEMLTDYLQNR